MEPEDTLKGNDLAKIAHYAAELVPSNQTPMVDATVAQAYATLALAHEMRANTLAIIWGAEEIGNGTIRKVEGELAELLGWDSM